jgi:hypothetical protein
MKYVYSMNMEKLHLLYAIGQVETIAGKWQRTEKERRREKWRGCERQCVTEKVFWHRS